MCQSQSLSLSLPPSPFSPGNHKFVFYICDFSLPFKYVTFRKLLLLLETQVPFFKILIN